MQKLTANRLTVNHEISESEAIAIMLAVETELQKLARHIGIDNMRAAHPSSRVAVTVAIWNRMRAILGYGDRPENTFPSDVLPHFFDRMAERRNDVTATIGVDRK